MRVLVVEDNDALRDAVTRGLAAEGFDVDATADGLDGLWRAQEFPYDALVLDIMLPGMNGYEICRTLRTADIATPILMLTAKDGDLDIAEGLDLGADDYLTKPFSFVVLVARLKAIVRRSAASPDGVVTAGPMRVELTARRCVVDGVVVVLTPREFALLEALALRLDEPITRRDLEDLVWGGELEVASNVVDVYVGYLRRKLGAAAPLLETVRGVGYRLVSTCG